MLYYSDGSEDLLEMQMAADLELLTPPEAAVVAGVSVRDVNRLIDEHILPKELYSNEANRRVQSGACALVRFYYRAASSLTAEERKYTIHYLWGESKGNRNIWLVGAWRRAKPNWTIRHEYLTVSFEEFVTETIAGHDQLAQARAIVVEDDAILGGTPVIKGTRVPVYDIAASVEAGIALPRLKQAYPQLNERQIELALLYAKATPPRGRPRSMRSDLSEAVARKVVRRRPA